MLRLPEVANNVWTVVVGCGEDTTQLAKGTYRHQGMDVRPKGVFNPRLCFLLFQPLQFLFLSPFAEVSGGMAIIDRVLGHKNIIGREVGLMVVTFLQNRCFIPHLKLNKVNLKVGVAFLPPPVAPN